jgi:hypothetical protein
MCVSVRRGERASERASKRARGGRIQYDPLGGCGWRNSLLSAGEFGRMFVMICMPWVEEPYRMSGSKVMPTPVQHFRHTSPGRRQKVCGGLMCGKRSGREAAQEYRRRLRQGSMRMHSSKGRVAAAPAPHQSRLPRPLAHLLRRRRPAPMPTTRSWGSPSASATSGQAIRTCERR